MLNIVFLKIIQYDMILKYWFNFIIQFMLNPESYGSSMISPRMMFNYDRGLNKSWNMS